MTAAAAPGGITADLSSQPVTLEDTDDSCGGASLGAASCSFLCVVGLFVFVTGSGTAGTVTGTCPGTGATASCTFNSASKHTCKAVSSGTSTSTVIGVNNCELTAPATGTYACSSYPAAQMSPTGTSSPALPESSPNTEKADDCGGASLGAASCSFLCVSGAYVVVTGAGTSGTVTGTCPGVGATATCTFNAASKHTCKAFSSATSTSTAVGVNNCVLSASATGVYACGSSLAAQVPAEAASGSPELPPISSDDDDCGGVSLGGASCSFLCVVGMFVVVTGAGTTGTVTGTCPGTGASATCTFNAASNHACIGFSSGTSTSTMVGVKNCVFGASSTGAYACGVTPTLPPSAAT